MTTGKQILQRKETSGQSVAQWWVTVCKDSRFDMLLTCARADLFQGGISEERQRGAEAVISYLLTVADNDAAPAPFPNPGLHHKMPPKDPPTEKPKA